METKEKMAIAGTGLVVAGVGLGIVGAALIVPCVVAWTARLVERGADGLATNLEGRWGPWRAICIGPSTRRKMPALPK
jgi:hypothetical protein